MTLWTDFNNAEDTGAFNLIPKGSLLKVRMTLKPGGYDDPAQGWTCGFATRSEKTGSVFLNAEFIVLEGEYAKRKLWTLIGLQSANGHAWGDMGRSFIKGALNSAFGLLPQDVSPAAQAKRRIRDFGDLDGLVFAAQVSWERDDTGEDKAVIKAPVTPSHARYAEVMHGGGASAAHGGTSAPSGATTAAPRTTAAPVATRPTWAQ